MRNIVQEFRLAAEEMRGAGYIQEEAVDAVLLAPHRDRGRVAAGPSRKPAQGGLVGWRIEGTHLQTLYPGPGVGGLVLEA
jgi:hypothetical protein